MCTIRPFSRRTRAVVTLSTIALLAAAGSARAASCVRDAARDTLNQEEQSTASLLFEAARGAEGQPVDRAACGDGSGPHDEVAEVAERTNVTPAQAEIRLVPSKNLFFVRIGCGYAAGPSEGSGGLLGLGLRMELLKGVALDLSFANVFVLSKDSDDAVSFEPMNHGSFTPVALGAIYRFRPLSDGTPYAGLGFGVRVFNPEFEQADSYDIRASLGYEMFRVSRLRLFVQADAILPTYKIRRKEGGSEETGRRSWPASVSLSLGLGLGGRPDRDWRD